MQDIKAVSHFVHKPHSQKVNIWGLRFFINACREKSLFHSFRYTAGDQETWFPTSHPKDKSSPKQKTSKILLPPTKTNLLSNAQDTAFQTRKKRLLSCLLPAKPLDVPQLICFPAICREFEASKGESHPGQQHHSSARHMGLPGPLYC